MLRTKLGSSELMVRVRVRVRAHIGCDAIIIFVHVEQHQLQPAKWIFALTLAMFTQNISSILTTQC